MLCLLLEASGIHDPSCISETPCSCHFTATYLSFRMKLHSFSGSSVEEAGKGFLEQWWRKVCSGLTLGEPLVSGPCILPKWCIWI